MIRKIIWALLFAGSLVPVLAYANMSAHLTGTLEVGARGDQVKVLQTILAADSSIYPEANISGFFGPLTKLAVKRFQLKMGLDQAGRVGPLTLAKLNAFADNIASSAQTTPAVTSSGNSQTSSSASLTTVTAQCKNPWGSSPATISWPIGLPCPAVATIGLPTPAPATAPTPTPTATTQNNGNTSASTNVDGTKNCAYTGSTQTFSWPAAFACPIANAPATPTPSPVSPSPTSSSVSPAPIKKPTATPTCLTSLGLTANSSPTEIANAAAKCAPVVLDPNQIDMSEKKMCSLNVLGKNYSFPYPSNRECPPAPITTAVVTQGTSPGFCTVTYNGKATQLAWPSNLPCK